MSRWGSQTALATALDINQAAVAQWGEYPPLLRQLQIEALSNGELRAEAECDQFRVPQVAA